MASGEGVWPQAGSATGIDLTTELGEPVETFTEAVLEQVWRHTGSELRVSVWFCGDGEIALLHGLWLDNPTPTDVISFPLEAPDDAENHPERAQGEIVVSVDTARRRAAEHGNSVRAELALYLVHGALHLAGHDDRNDVALTKMIDAERAILSSLGMSVRQRHDLE
ncbi:MAG: rRNA maturation RNase YbeY [Planctomycetes bacterium]|jgi:rRNA maturation RNase YbeY|nr:rRNA maturation RNase YbeY [Planctomycetota bacterium]